MSGRLYRKTADGIEPLYPATTAERVSYGDTTVRQRLDTLAQAAELVSVDAAQRLTTARTLGLTGDATGGATFDGSADVSLQVVVKRITDNELEEILT